MTQNPWRRATVWITSIGLSVLLALIPFVRSSDASTPSVSATTVTTTPTPTTATTTAAADTTALDEALANAGGKVSVSVTDLTSGATSTSGDSDHLFDTASIVKVDILTALLLKAQDEGRSLTANEKALATRMIENSDNSAATALFNEVGGASGLTTANDRIGLTDTVVGTDGNWGLTETSSSDQIRLLEQVFTSDSELSAASRTYMRSLMGNVESSQRFGVTAAADDPQEAELKVGWLQRSATGLWVVDSIGMIEKDGHTYLVAVLSDGNTSYDGGVALISAVAKAAVAATI